MKTGVGIGGIFRSKKEDVKGNWWQLRDVCPHSFLLVTGYY